MFSHISVACVSEFHTSKVFQEYNTFRKCSFSIGLTIAYTMQLYNYSMKNNICYALTNKEWDNNERFLCNFFFSEKTKIAPFLKGPILQIKKFVFKFRFHINICWCDSATNLKHYIIRKFFFCHFSVCHVSKLLLTVRT